jgi:hypothetical protein
VGKLKDQLIRELEQDSQRAASEIVAFDESDRPRSGAFSRACETSGRETIKRLMESARRELRSRPGCISTLAAERAFRTDYSAVPTSELDAIIREFRA